MLRRVASQQTRSGLSEHLPHSFQPIPPGKPADTSWSSYLARRPRSSQGCEETAAGDRRRPQNSPAARASFHRRTTNLTTTTVESAAESETTFRGKTHPGKTRHHSRRCRWTARAGGEWSTAAWNVATNSSRDWMQEMQTVVDQSYPVCLHSEHSGYLHKHTWSIIL